MVTPVLPTQTEQSHGSAYHPVAREAQTTRQLSWPTPAAEWAVAEGGNRVITFELNLADPGHEHGVPCQIRMHQLEDPHQAAHFWPPRPVIQRLGYATTRQLISEAVDTLTNLIYPPAVVHRQRHLGSLVPNDAFEPVLRLIIDHAGNVNPYLVLPLSAFPLPVRLAHTPSDNPTLSHTPTVVYSILNLQVFRSPGDQALAPAPSLVPMLSNPPWKFNEAAYAPAHSPVARGALTTESLSWGTDTARDAVSGGRNRPIQFDIHVHTLGRQQDVPVHVRMQQLEDPHRIAHFWPPSRTVHWTFQATVASSEKPFLDLVLEFVLPEEVQ
ncbi:hypothetical protein JCM10908_005706 [Rhodotorula pacifica]|uniref:uncharacterized protein n=1 Tax=Rhodotorula pacifica TaxID=1495444 RepID=UPI0031745561